MAGMAPLPATITPAAATAAIISENTTIFLLIADKFVCRSFDIITTLTEQCFPCFYHAVHGLSTNGGGNNIFNFKEME
jgi:hypothetical protein